MTAFPYALTRPVVFRSQGKITVCSISGLCHRFDPAANMWRSDGLMMMKQRDGAATLQLNMEDYWITGGYAEDATTLADSEIFVGSRGEFIPGPDLPQDHRFHCLVAVNASHVIGLGGLTGFLMETATNEFTQMNGLPQKYNYYPACLVYKFNEEKRLVVAYNQTADIYSFATGIWNSAGLSLPRKFIRGASVPYLDGLLMMGGQNSSTVTEFNARTETFTAWTRTLDTRRKSHSALLATNDEMNCH